MVEQLPDKEILQWIDYSEGPISLTDLVDRLDANQKEVEKSCHRLRESQFLNQHLPQDAWTIRKKGIDWLDEIDQVPVRTYRCPNCRSQFKINIEETHPARFCPWCGEHTIESTEVEFQ